MSEEYPNLPEKVQPASRGYVVPTTVDELRDMAADIVKSGWAPKGMNKPETVFVAIQMGLELGLAPMQALQNIAVINGRPSIWGDAMPGLVKASGLLESFSESFEGKEGADSFTAVCVAKRRGEANPIVQRFSVADAKRANLWDKQGPWTQYPKRMLQMRARSWALRDGFPDVLRGLQASEEVRDIPIDVTPIEVAQPETAAPEDDWEPAYRDLCGLIPEDLQLYDDGKELARLFVVASAESNDATKLAVIEAALANEERFMDSFAQWCCKNHPKATTNGAQQEAATEDTEGQREPMPPVDKAAIEGRAAAEVDGKGQPGLGL